MGYQRKQQAESQFRSYSKATTKYSDFDLIAFDRIMQTYWTERDLPNGAKIGFHDVNALLVREHALTPSGSIVIDGLTHLEDHSIDCQPIRYESLMNKISQWQAWKTRMKVGEKNKLADPRTVGYKQYHDN